MPAHRRLKITGDVSIEPVSANERVGQISWRFLIMGPTGAGKSSFIEAFAGISQSLQLSKDQLAGYTQCVSAYKLVNVSFSSTRHPIYLVDTPGFSDTKISEKEILDMVSKWMDENGVSYFHAILFLSPITEPRLAGSKRRTIDMLKGFLRPSGTLSSIAFVTTMWDQVNSERSEQRAESKFAQLTGEILKDFVAAGGKMSRFTNTRDSALQILDAIAGYNATPYSLQYEVSSYLYRDLHERIEGALQQKKSIESHLATHDAQINPTLKSILENNHRENEETLNKFVAQHMVFGEIPVGLERAAVDLRRKIAADVVPADSYQETVFRFWAQGLKAPDVPKVDYYQEAQSLFTLASPVLPPRPRRLAHAFKGIIRRLINEAKRQGNRWFNRRA